MDKQKISKYFLRQLIYIILETYKEIKNVSQSVF